MAKRATKQLAFRGNQQINFLPNSSAAHHGDPPTPPPTPWLLRLMAKLTVPRLLLSSRGGCFEHQQDSTSIMLKGILWRNIPKPTRNSFYRIDRLSQLFVFWFVCCCHLSVLCCGLGSFPRTCFSVRSRNSEFICFSRVPFSSADSYVETSSQNKVRSAPSQHRP